MSLKEYTLQFSFSIGKIGKVAIFKKLKKIVGPLFEWVHAPRRPEKHLNLIITEYRSNLTVIISDAVALMAILPENPIVMYSYTDYRQMKKSFGMRTLNSMKTSGHLENILNMISVQYQACPLRISNDLVGKTMHYIIDKSYAQPPQRGTVACTLETGFTCFDFFHLLPQLPLG